MKKYLVVFLSLLLIFTLTACDDSEANKDDVDVEDTEIVEETDEEEAVDENEEEEVDKDINKTEKEVTLYFPNIEYIETGDESLEQVLPKKQTLDYKDSSLEEAVVRALMVHEDEGDPERTTAIPKSAKLIDVKMEGKMALVNFASEGLNGASLEEVLTVEQIVKSLLELDTVEEVQFLVDGEKAESLMGHLDVSEPFSK